MTLPNKRLLLPLLAVALLGGVYALLVTHPATDEDDTETVSLTDMDSEEIRKITVSLRNGSSFTVKIKTDDSGTEYTVAGDRSGSYDQNSLSSLLSTACSVSGTLIDPVSTDLDRYGLDEGAEHDVITITQNDGTKNTLIFGLTSDTLGGTYCLTQDSSDVCFVSSSTVETLLQERDSYLSLSVLGSYYTLSSSLTAMTIETQHGTALSIERRNTDDMDSDVSSAYSTFLLTEPERWDADDDALSSGILSNLQSGLTAQSVAKEHATQSDRKQYGLDEPRAHISLSFSNEDVILLIGNTEDGLVYVMTQGGDTIYCCSAEYFAFLDDLDWTEYRSPYLLAFAKRELQRARLTYNGHTCTASLTYVPAEENEEEDSDTITGTLDGDTMDSDAINQLYLSLTSLHAISVSEESASGDELLSLTLRLTDGTRHTLSMSKGGSREYLVDVDGSGYRYTISQSDFDSLLESFGAN